MQPATTQNVPATSSAPAQAPVGQVSAKYPAPTPLDLDALRQVGGGAAPGHAW
jgi:hypothetical protein